MTTLAVELKDVETLIIAILSTFNVKHAEWGMFTKIAGLSLTFEVFRKREGANDNNWEAFGNNEILFHKRNLFSRLLISNAAIEMIAE